MTRVAGKKINCMYSMYTLGFALLAYLCSSTEVEIFSYDLTGRNKQKSRPLNANSIREFTSIPGLVLLHTDKGVALLHPGTLELIKMELKGHTHGAQGAGGREEVQYQFNVEEALFSVVKVWDVETSVNDDKSVNGGKASLSLSLWLCCSYNFICDIVIIPSFIITGVSSDHRDQSAISSSTSAPDSTEDNDSDDDSDSTADLSGVDFGSCVAAFTVNDRLMIIRTQHRSVVHQ